MEYEIYRSDELTHHGIKGMRWGVRRFQRKDGSLTPAGERRRAKLEAKIEKLGGKKDPNGNSSAKYSQDNIKKKVGDMTNEELTRAINRARMEDEYNRLRPEPIVEKNPLMKKFVNEAIVPAAVNSGRKFIENALTKAAEKVLGDKIDPNSYEALKKVYDKMDIQNKIDKLKNPDKYLSEEDKTKRQNRENDAEDRAARKEGYKDAADKAVKTREAEEAARKAKADEAARVANEPKSEEYYNARYSVNTGEKTQVNPNESRALAVVSDTMNKSYSSVVNDSNVSRGEALVQKRSNSAEPLMTYDEDGNFIGYWSDTKGGLDGTF